MTPPPTLPLRVLLRVFGASLLVFSSFGAFLPIFPLWVARVAPSHTEVGLATTLAAGVGLVMARPLAARLMEGRPRAPTLATGVAVCALTAALMPAFDTLWPILIARAGQGLGFGLVTTAALSLVTDLAPPHMRGQVLGYFGATNAVSLLVGPAAGALLARHWSVDAAFYAAGALCLFAFPLLWRLPEPPKPLLAGRPFNLTEALRLPALRVMASTHFLALLLHGGLLALLPLRFEGHSGWATVELFFVVDAVVLIALRVALGRRFDTWPRLVFVVGGLLALSGAAALVAFGTSDWALLGAGALYGVGFGSYMPGAGALVGDVVPESHRARGFAVFMLSADLGLAFGGVFMGPIADAVDVPTSFALGALCPVIAALGVWARRARLRQTA